MTGIVARRRLLRQNNRTTIRRGALHVRPARHRRCRSLPEPAARGLILHVDDDEACAVRPRMLLRSAGFETREASCGEQALAQVETLRGRLDVLIVDYNLGAGMTGTEVAEEFARLLGHAVPTVMLTGDPGERRGAVARGCAGVGGAQAAAARHAAGRAAAAGGIPPRGGGRRAALASADVRAQLRFAYSGSTRGRFFSMSLMRSFGAGCVLRNFGGLPPTLRHWPSCSTA